VNLKILVFHFECWNLGGTMYEFGKKLGEGAYGYVITARLEAEPKVTYACKVIRIFY
jgi:hypothetical protein